VQAASPEAIIAFWEDAGPAKWFAHDAEFDVTVCDRFAEQHHAAARGELADWINSWTGSLALLLLLDQFPRNMFRGSAHAFATDPLARAIAETALSARHDALAPQTLRIFYYLPFEHSEALADQERGVALCDALDSATGSDFARWARLHRDIIAQFGRFPHRNAALGRATTPSEQAFLDAGGFAG
jgi:uncharacterized protein (DUF924 family)